MEDQDLVESPMALLRQRSVSRNVKKPNPSVVSRQIAVLFSAYRKDDFADADGFVVQLGMVLSEFPEEVVIYVTSPSTGLQRRSKWPPTLSEVLDACENHLEFLTRRANHVPSRPAPVAAPIGDLPHGALANVWVPEWHRRYEGLRKWADSADPVLWKHEAREGQSGIWVAFGIWETGNERSVQREKPIGKKLDLSKEAQVALAEHSAAFNESLGE